MKKNIPYPQAAKNIQSADFLMIPLILSVLFFYGALPQTVRLKFIFFGPGGFWIYLIDILVLVGTVIYSAMNYRNISKPQLAIALVLFFYTVSLTPFWGSNPGRVASNSFDTLYFLVLLAVLQPSTIYNKWFYNGLNVLCVFVALQVVLLTTFNYEFVSAETGRTVGGGLARVRTTAGPATASGIFLFISAGWLYIARNYTFSISVLLCTLSLALLAILLLLSRGAILMTFLLIIAILGFRLSRGSFWLYLTGSVFIVLGVSAVLLANEEFLFFLERRLGYANVSDVARWARILWSVDLVLANPFFGIGPGNLMQLEKLLAISTGTVNSFGFSPHNFYLIILIHYGPLFFILFFSSIAISAFKVAKEKNYSLLFLALISLGIGGNLEVIYASFPFSVLLVLILKSDERKRFKVFSCR